MSLVLILGQAGQSGYVLVVVMAESKRVCGNMQSLLRSGLRMVHHYFCSLLLGKASHNARPDSRGRDSKTQLFSKRYRDRGKGHGCRERSEELGPFMPSRQPEAVLGAWGNIRRQNRPKSLPLGISHVRHWWWHWWNRRHNLVLSLRRPVATVGSMWTHRGASGTVLGSSWHFKGPHQPM